MRVSLWRVFRVSSASSSSSMVAFALACALALPACTASCNLLRDLCNLSWALTRCFSSLARSFSESTSACLQALSRCTTRLWDSWCSRCKGVVTDFLLADMTCLRADVIGPILDPRSHSRQRTHQAVTRVRHNPQPFSTSLSETSGGCVAIEGAGKCPQRPSGSSFPRVRERRDHSRNHAIGDVANNSVRQWSRRADGRCAGLRSGSLPVRSARAAVGAASSARCSGTGLRGSRHCRSGH
ncbi:hypothetical protein D3C78_838380 [compost metagenome]